jgi:hypothetical protein
MPAVRHLYKDVFAVVRNKAGHELPVAPPVPPGLQVQEAVQEAGQQDQHQWRAQAPAASTKHNQPSKRIIVAGGSMEAWQVPDVSTKSTAINFERASTFNSFFVPHDLGGKCYGYRWSF